MSKRANGEGNIRKRPDGKWEGRYVYCGKRHSVYGKTQAEVRKKLTEAQAQIDGGAYIAPSKITVTEWLDRWQKDCLRKVKDSTKQRYEMDIRLYIKPEIGGMQLSALTPSMITAFYSKMQDRGLSAKSIRNMHGTLHKAFQQAKKESVIKENPCADAVLPETDAPKREMRPLKDNELPEFLKRIRGHKMESLYYAAVFTGMRESELIGLTWDCIDFQHGTVHLYRQLSRGRRKGESWTFTTLKNKTNRTFAPPASVMNTLKAVRKQQAEQRLKCGGDWRNEQNFVFTNEAGQHLSMYMVYKYFKSIVKEMGLPQVRFHDLRHTYATLALQNGMDYKTLSNNLGHATVAFTMDVYGHVSETMMQNGAEIMQRFIESL